jgi:C4-dicarboxylate-binding protein DctP
MIRRSLLALLCLLFVVGGNALAQSPILIKFSHVVAKDTPKGKAAEKFKELAEAATKGRVKIEVYANSTLYKDKEELEALQLGALQMLAPSMAKFGPLGVKEFELFDFPYLFTDQQSLERVTNGPVGKEMLKRLETKGLIGLSFWDNGFKIMSSNRSMHVPTDLKGLKLRIQASKVLDEQMRVLGANPQVMAFSEVYQALQTGVVDGLENVPSNLYTQKMHEVQKHMTVTNHGYIGYAVVVNKKFWEKLPADVRSQLDGAMKEATEYANKIAQQENEAALDAIRKSGKVTVYMPTDAEKAEWRKVMLPVHKTMEERIGKDLIAAASKAAVGK